MEEKRVNSSRQNAAPVINSSLSLFLPKYARFALKNLDVGSVRLERGVKSAHEHASVQVSVALSRQPMIAVAQKRFGVVSKQLLIQAGSCVISSWQRHTILWEKPAEWVSFHLNPQIHRTRRA